MKLEWGAQTNSTALLPKGWGVLIHCCSPGQQSPPQIPAQCQRIDAFELWWCRRLLRVPWTARRSNQSILKEIHPEYSLKDCCRSSSTVATWRKELIHWKRPWCWETWGQEKKGTREDERLDSTTDSMDMSSGREWRTEEPRVLQSTASPRVRNSLATEQLLFRNKN